MEHINNLVINSIYDFDNALSINELLCKFWEKIEEVINVSNECIDILNWIKEEGLPDEVQLLINQLVADGTIGQIINVDSGSNNAIIEDYNITFENRWTNYNSSGTERSKINYKNNVVNINFKIKSGNITNGTKICSIDSKYSPTRDIYTPCFIWDGEKTELQGFAIINKNGEVIINGVNTNKLLYIEFNYLK